MFCKSACNHKSSAPGFIKVDPLAIEKQRQEKEAEEQRLQEEAERAQLEERRQRLEEQERLRREEEERVQREQREQREREEQEEQVRREREERARREQEEQARRAREEKVRREREEQVRREREEQERKKEEERQEQERKERQEALEQFYTRHGFTGTNDARRSGCAVFKAATTYPLHCAAELGDEKVVAMLLKEGATTSQKDSSGRTAAQVAQKKNKGNSHEAVLRLLGARAVQPRAGGC